MISLDKIATDIAAELQEVFSTVRICAVQNPEQFLTEIRAINPEKLPAVLIVFDGFAFTAESTVREDRLTLVVLDEFRSASDERALELFKLPGKIMEILPPDGRDLNGVWIHPEDCTAGSTVIDYAVLAIGLVCKQSVI